jgi:hypothetical protein
VAPGSELLGGSEKVDVFCSERSDASGQIDWSDAPGSNGFDELTWTEPGGSERIGRRKQTVGNHFAARNRSAARTDDVGLADITDQFADLTRGQPRPVSVDDCGVPDQPNDILVGARPLILSLCLDQTLPSFVGSRLGRLTLYRHPCHYDIPVRR